MTQTIVNFVSGVVYNGFGQITSTTTSQRVFDFEISADAQAGYLASMNSINQILTSTSPTPTQISDLNTLLIALNNWSQVKYVDSNTGSQVTNAANYPSFLTGTGQTTMDRYMAQYLEQLFRTLRAAGYEITNPSTAALTNAIAAIQSEPSIYQVGNIITQAISAAQQARIVGDATTQSQSLQQVLMVDYISVGNQILSDQMGALNDAINTNQTVLSYLNSLQDLMNQKDPERFIQQLSSLFANGGNVISDSQYETYETQTFNRTLGTQAKFSDSSISSYITNNPDATFTQAFQQNILDPNSSTGAATISTIVTNLQSLQAEIVAKGGSSSSGVSLALTSIINDIQSVSSISTWVQDTVSGKQGDFQTSLNNAIVASQSFNDTQREQLQQTMFVFEEFYKSADSLLNRMTQLIEKMAGLISR